MSLSSGTVGPGGPSRVIQGFFPGRRPTMLQASPASVAPVRPQAPAPDPGPPGFSTRSGTTGSPKHGSTSAGAAPRPAPAGRSCRRSRSPAPSSPRRRLRPQAPQPILPQAARPATVQPQAGNAFALPANFTLKPRGSGQPLPEPIQKKMESFFNTSFADVRVHVGHEAPSIGALAFTHGTDLYFAPGQYNPQSTQGQQLLGHELTHVVQQRAGRVRNPLGSGVAVVQDPALEAEAERMGHAGSVGRRADSGEAGREWADRHTVARGDFQAGHRHGERGDPASQDGGSGFGAVRIERCPADTDVGIKNDERRRRFLHRINIADIRGSRANPTVVRSGPAHGAAKAPANAAESSVRHPGTEWQHHYFASRELGDPAQNCMPDRLRRCVGSGRSARRDGVDTTQDSGSEDPFGGGRIKLGDSES